MAKSRTLLLCLVACLPAAACATVSVYDEPLTAAKVMVNNTVEAVPVLDREGRLLGIVTESDIVRWLVR